jgi:hypothetical protein
MGGLPCNCTPISPFDVTGWNSAIAARGLGEDLLSVLNECRPRAEGMDEGKAELVRTDGIAMMLDVVLLV